MNVLNFGSLNYDYVYHVDHMVREGETLSCNQMMMFFGGKGLNQSIALARAGVKVAHAGVVGVDGDDFFDLCHEHGISTDYILRVSGKSGHTIIQIDSQAQNSILLYGGANQKVTEAFVDDVVASMNEKDILVLQNEINMLNVIIDKAYEKNIRIVLNPSPYNEKVSMCDLKKVSVLILNEIEGMQMTGFEDKFQIINELSDRYPQTTIILTLGTEGVICNDKGKLYEQKAYQVDAVDTTGAGDTFTGYYVAGLLEDKPMEVILDQSSKAAAIAVTRNGAVPSIPTIKEVEVFPFLTDSIIVG